MPICCDSSAAEIEKISSSRVEMSQNSRRDWGLNDPLADSIEIDLNRLGRFRRLFFSSGVFGGVAGGAAPASGLGGSSGFVSGFTSGFGAAASFSSSLCGANGEAVSFFSVIAKTPVVM